MFLLFPHIDIGAKIHVRLVKVSVGGVYMSPVILVPGDELLEAALHDAGHPVSLADVTHEFDRNCLDPTEQREDQYDHWPHFHVVPFTQPSNH